jgi:hypothetical protein
VKNSRLPRARRIQQTPRPKVCPLCRKPVTEADFDGNKARYTGVARRKEMGQESIAPTAAPTPNPVAYPVTV